MKSGVEFGACAWADRHLAAELHLIHTKGKVIAAYTIRQSAWVVCRR